MEPHGVERHRSTVGVVSGVRDELVVEGQHRPFVEATGVIGFDYLLRAVVERAIACSENF